MTKTLLTLQGEKLPQEQVWVDANEMYQLYDRMEVDTDEFGVVEYIITDVINDGLVVERVQ